MASFRFAGSYSNQRQMRRSNDANSHNQYPRPRPLLDDQFFNETECFLHNESVSLSPPSPSFPTLPPQMSGLRLRPKPHQPSGFPPNVVLISYIVKDKLFRVSIF